MTDRVRVDRASVQNYTDATRANVGNNRSLGEDVDRQQAQQVASREGGVGSDELTRQRASTNRHATDVNTGIERTSNRTSEQTDQFINAARASANRSIRSI
ncbi:hypothetical protein [Aeromicrobium halocynthiae]|uniref:hypothetical protein n=1 Tax=Aeromicrobium halocynthiae TaxID=560557 RepID=UPI0031D0960F